MYTILITVTITLYILAGIATWLVFNIGLHIKKAAWFFDWIFIIPFWFVIVLAGWVSTKFSKEKKGK